MSAERWRPLSVEQPAPLTDVLATAVEDDVRTVYMLHLDPHGRWHWSGDGESFACGRVTHWMPLPAPAR